MSNYIKEKQAAARKAGDVTTYDQINIECINRLLELGYSLEQAIAFNEGCNEELGLPAGPTEPAPAPLRIFQVIASATGEVLKTVNARSRTEVLKGFSVTEGLDVVSMGLFNGGAFAGMNRYTVKA